MILNFRLGKIVDYAQKRVSNFDQMWVEFWGGGVPDETELFKEKIIPLFNEWLIYEFKQKSGVTFISEYYLRNPDRLSDKILAELKQVIETEKFGLFEVEKVNQKMKWLSVYSLFEGRHYKIYDNSASSHAVIGDVFWGRVARLNGKYLLCGSDPMKTTMNDNKNARKEFLEMGKRGRFEIVDVIDIFFRDRLRVRTGHQS